MEHNTQRTILPMGTVPARDALERPFIPRKSHTKSRGGCFYCKQRRVKCTETRPSCELCSSRDMPCEYPLSSNPHTRRARSKTTLRLPLLPQPLPTSFTMSDLRLFHHFMLKAHPHHPIGNEIVWVEKVPVLAHQYDFLMHAMLALAASNLTACSTANFTHAALSHRVQAVRSLKDILTNRPSSATDADAILATFYTLGFQALYMDDGLIDFLIMVRGCLLVTCQIQTDGFGTVFHFADAEAYINHMDVELDDFPFINPELACSATASLEALRPLCQEVIEILMVNLIQAIIIEMQRSAVQAYFSFMRLYEAIAAFTYKDFLYFTDTTNEVMQIVLAHFVALHIIAAPIIMREELKFKKVLSIEKSRDWLRSVISNVRPSQQHYLEWPAALMDCSALPTIQGSVLQLL